MSTQTQHAVDLLMSLATGDQAPSAIINPDHYTQHNLSAPDGLAGFRGLQKLISTGRLARVAAFLGLKPNFQTVRAFEDGKYVFTHMKYSLYGMNLIGFDVFRFENGKAVEHWDNLQRSAKPNASGHTMTDGPLVATDLGRTEANKTLVRSFVEEILIKRHEHKLAGFFNGDSYIQHSPKVADGVSALRAELARAGVKLKYEKIHLLLGEGNFVFVASEGSIGGKPAAFFELFRVENGKLAEHWDTVVTIPPRRKWKNANGKF